MSFADAHIGDLAAALVDDQLDQGTRNLVLLHLGCCPGCRADVEEQRQLKARLHALGTPGLPSGLMARLGALSDPAPPREDPLHDLLVAEPEPLGSEALATVLPIASPLQAARRSSMMRNPARGRRMLVGAASLLLVGAGTAVAVGGDGQAAPAGPSTSTFSTSFSTPLTGAPGSPKTPGMRLTDPAFGAVTASFNR
jgi:anti-sigma factor RsiW